MKKVFFGERGITATSANHLANIAKEHVKQLEDKINAINFINQDISLLAGGNRRIIKVGINKEAFDSLSESLYKTANIKSFIAWVREAIKAKDNLAAELHKTAVETYVEKTGRTKLSFPIRESYVTEEDIKAEMSIKDLNEYLTLETIAAQIGNISILENLSQLQER